MADMKRKERFFEVNIPVVKKTTNLIAYDLEELNGKKFSYDLTRILRGKNILLYLKIKVENGKAEGHSIGLEIVPSFLRRMVRKGTNYVEDSFSAECKDNLLKIKPFLVTRRKVSRAVRKNLREKCREELINYVRTRDTETLTEELLRGQLQKYLGLKLKKVYPLSFCDIRTFRVENKK